MSKGNQVVTFRLPPELVEEMRQAIESANATRRSEPYTWSEWVRQCIEAKLSHLKRSAKSRRKVVPFQAPPIQEEPERASGVETLSDIWPEGQVRA